MFRYIDKLLGFQSFWFWAYLKVIPKTPHVHLIFFLNFVDRIYPIDLEIKDTTDTAESTSYLDLHTSDS